MLTFTNLYLLYGIIYFVRRWFDNLFPSVDEDKLDEIMSDRGAGQEFMNSKKHLLLFMILEFSWLVIGLKTPYVGFFVILLSLSLLKTIASFMIVRINVVYINAYSAVNDFIVGIIISIMLLYHFQIIDWQFLTIFLS